MDPKTDAAARALACFDDLVELDADTRSARLAVLRAGDPELAAALERMLAADAESGVLDRSAGAFGSSLAARAAGEAPADPSARQRIGAFELKRPLGQGGMGEVWLAEREEGGFRQQVALKLLRRGFHGDDSLRRFVQERRILADLSHPAIARFIDGGVTDAGVPWYAMEYVDGMPITEHGTKQALDVRARAELLVQVCAAVAYAQNRLIVHRDLKPSNILVDAEGRPHLLDFGIAKLLAENAPAHETATGLRAMSPAYAAPEQVLDQPISTATDVYALGVVLFELLTGELPHQRGAATLETLAEQVRSEVTERPSVRARRVARSGATTGFPATSQRLARGIGAELDLIVLTALRREPERRYANAAALGDDLRRWLDGRPISAQSDSTGYRMRKFVARHRLAVASAAAVAVALVAGLGVALWQAERAREQAERAEAQLQRAESIKAFALSLFREQDPFARGKPAPRPAGELIALGVERAQKFTDPDQRGEILSDLGEIQVSLGDAKAARPVLEQAVRERAAVHGEDSVEAAAARSNLAAALMPLGDYPAALALLERSTPVLTRLAGPDAPVTLRAESRRARVLVTSSRNAEALPLMQDLVKRSDRVFGPEATETLVALADLGSLQENMDQLDAAEATGRDVIARLERVVGREHVQLVRPLGRLGDILRRRMQTEEAEALYSRALAIARTTGNPMLIGQLLMRRGDLQRRMGKFDDAGASLEEAARSFPPESGEFAQAEAFRGSLLRMRGDKVGAAAAYLRSHKAFLAALGPDSVYGWDSALEYAGAMREAGRGAEAERLLLETDAKLRKISDPKSYEVMAASQAVAKWRAEQRRYPEAVRLFRESLDLCVAIYGEDHPGTLEARVDLAQNLAEVGDADSRREALAELGKLDGAAKITPEVRKRADELAARLREG